MGPGLGLGLGRDPTKGWWCRVVDCVSGLHQVNEQAYPFTYHHAAVFSAAVVVSLLGRRIIEPIK